MFVYVRNCIGKARERERLPGREKNYRNIALYIQEVLPIISRKSLYKKGQDYFIIQSKILKFKKPKRNFKTVDSVS